MEERDIHATLSDMRNHFLKSLLEIVPGMKVNGSMIARHPGNLNIQFSGFEAELLLTALQPHVAASTGSACTSGQTEPSHVLSAIGLSSKEAESSIRFSLGRFTTIAEIGFAVSTIQTAFDRLDGAISIK